MDNVNNVSYDRPRIGGAISVGVIDATLPRDTKILLNENLKSLGYISGDGLINGNSPGFEKIKTWGGGAVLAVASGKPDTFEFKSIEISNIDILKAVYGEKSVSGSLETGITIKANAARAESHSYVVGMVLKDGVLKRVIIPNGIVSKPGDIEYIDDDAAGLKITPEALSDRDGNNHCGYIIKSGE